MILLAGGRVLLGKEKSLGKTGSRWRRETSSHAHNKYSNANVLDGQTEAHPDRFRASTHYCDQIFCETGVTDSNLVIREQHWKIE